MKHRVAGLFRCDADGRSLAVNQWDGGTPPRFHLARTAGENICRIRCDVSRSAADALRALAAEEPPLRDVHGLPTLLREYLKVLGPGGRATGRGSTSAGPVYWFEHDPAPGGETVLVDSGNARLLRGALESWLPDVPHRQPLVAVVQDGRAVAVCASVRISGQGHEAGVETDPEYRRRGYAARVVAAWSREVKRRGVPRCFYSTSWENEASQHVARRLGLTLIGADFSIA